MSRIIRFFKEVWVELGKVVWPSRRETTNHTLMVIGISLAVAVFLGAADYLLNYLLGFILE